MDPLLKGPEFRFFIDEINLLGSVKSEEFPKNQLGDKLDDNYFFEVNLLPDISSVFFPPFHMRKIIVTEKLLTRNFYQNYVSKSQGFLINQDSSYFSGDIIEGGYYSIPTENFPGGELPQLLNDSYQGVFTEYKMTPPYIERDSDFEVLNLEEGISMLNSRSEERRDDALNLYCFNVGQGDSTLIIFPNGNSYIVDINVYPSKKLHQYINNVKRILGEKGLSQNRLKGLIITHKHADHLRGAAQLLNSNAFQIDYFLLNYDFSHPTNIVCKLIQEAKRFVSKRININNVGSFYEGNVKVEILNPTDITKDDKVCSDLNDSSIVLKFEYGENSVFLNGDAGYNILNNSLDNVLSNSILKVSHHGSVTGTDDKQLKLINPEYAFISAGDHKKYRHPHQPTLDSINKFNVDLSVSKHDGSIVYTISPTKILKNNFV